MSQGENQRQDQLIKSRQVQPMWQIVLSQFLEHRAALLGLSVILFYIALGILAPFIAYLGNLDPNRQNPIARYQRPGSFSIATNDRKEEIIVQLLSAEPMKIQTLAHELNAASSHSPSKEGAEDIVLNFFQQDPADIQKTLPSLSPSSQKVLDSLQSQFKTIHLLGTDELGRDVFIRMIYGARVSMGVGVLVAIASSILGLLIGAIAGFYGGFIDTVLMRITDGLLALPRVPIMILFAAVDLRKIPWMGSIVSTRYEAILKLSLILVLFSWMSVARLVRGGVLSLREQEFILAAKTIGARDHTIILRHIFPNVVAPLLVSVTLGVGGAILSESALSYLGLGVQPPTPSWGNMLVNAQELMNSAPFLAIIPGLNILILAISFNYVGDGLQDAVDPKAVRR